MRFDHVRVRAALMMSCRARAATFALAMRKYLPPSSSSYTNYYYSSYRGIEASGQFAARCHPAFAAPLAGRYRQRLSCRVQRFGAALEREGGPRGTRHSEAISPVKRAVMDV